MRLPGGFVPHESAPAGVRFPQATTGFLDNDCGPCSRLRQSAEELCLGSSRSQRKGIGRKSQETQDVVELCPGSGQPCNSLHSRRPDRCGLSGFCGQQRATVLHWWPHWLPGFDPDQRTDLSALELTFYDVVVTFVSDRREGRTENEELIASWGAATVRFTGCRLFVALNFTLEPEFLLG